MSNQDFVYCGRVFSAQQMAWIGKLIESEPSMNRACLSRVVCQEIGWLRPDGRLKDMSCRVAMLRMERDGLISLPAPLKGNRNGRIRPRLTAASDLQANISLGAGALGELSFKPVNTPKDSSFWNELIERYHYLGYKPLPGAQMRYLVFGGGHLLAVLGFGAAAWALAPRDQFIGWTAEQRKLNLHLVVNNARFLILPWVKSKNLASRILAGIARQLASDWKNRYGYSPVLLETFVQQDRFKGTCYRASNWHHAGQTKGRGKLDRANLNPLPIKEIYLYPLDKRFRKKLTSNL